MEINLKLVFVFMISLCLFLLYGCSSLLEKRGMLSDDIYYSTHNPNIRISVASGFSYQKGEPSEFQHQFVNEKARKFFAINYYRQTEPLDRIDYFDSIEYFFSEHLRGIIRMGKSDLLNENWVYCDRIIFANNSCALNRHMAVMTGSQNNFFQLSYYKELKDIDCDEWENLNELSNNQKKS